MRGATFPLGRAQRVGCVWFHGWERADPEAGCPPVNGAWRAEPAFPGGDGGDLGPSSCMHIPSLAAPLASSLLPSLSHHTCVSLEGAGCLPFLGRESSHTASFPRRGVHTDPEPPEELPSLQPQRPVAESMTACCMEGFYGRGPCFPGRGSFSHCFPWGNTACARGLLCAQNLSPVPEVQGILFGHRAMF